MGAKTRSILVRGARELLTLRGDKRPRRGSGLKDLGIITDGSLLIRDGVVVEVGSTRRVENLSAARGAIEINATGRVVMPGFVDSHTHLVFPPPHAAPERIDAARASHAHTAKHLQSIAQGWMEAMARHGTTTAEAKTGCYPDIVAELKLLRVLLASQGAPLDLAATCLLQVSGIDAPAGEGQLFSQFLPAVRRRGMIHFADVVWEERPAAVQFLDAVIRLGLPSKIHAAGTAAGAVQAAVDRRAVSVDHIELASPRDAALLAGSSTIATLLPASSWGRGTAFAPARMLIDSGAAVALATDFSPHQPSTWSMQSVIGLACTYMRMTPAEAISAATINGAHALGWADRAGSLEPGKSADLLLLNVSDHRDLAKYFGVNLVRMTMKRGTAIYHEANLTS